MDHDEDFVLEAETKEYHKCLVTAFRTENAEKYYPFCPWRFRVRHGKDKHSYVGMPNYCESKRSALRRGWHRAKWLNDGTYHDRYR